MLATPRSMLFVSGEKAERFPKAVATGADVVCIDLEDAVLPEAKPRSRTAVIAWLRANARPDRATALALRINGVRTRDGLEDVLELAAASAPVPGALPIDWLLCPKVEAGAEIECLRAWLPAPEVGIVALLETPRGIEHAPEIAAALAVACPAGAGNPKAALMLGGADLSAELGVPLSTAGLAYARGRLVNAARSAGLQAWDVPCLEIDDPEVLRTETRAVMALGFTCKTAIHPRQVGVIHDVFKPDPDEVQWAQEILAVGPGAGGAWIFRGRLVDAPVLKRARRVVELDRIARNA
jgi:citrate lyase beta subunit